MQHDTFALFSLPRVHHHLFNYFLYFLELLY